MRSYSNRWRVFHLLVLIMSLAALTLLGGGSASSRARAADITPVTVTNYTDPSQVLAWGGRSHWKQPWRSYMDTVPATTLLDATGINFNVQTWKPGVAASTAKLLGDSGFRRARIEVPWSSLDYDDPSQMTEGSREKLETTLNALKQNGIRPLILLNANSAGPCPVKMETIELTRPAPTGSRTIHVAPADLAKIVPGRTGIRSGGTAANYLFTSTEPDGTVQLSAPLGEIWQSDKSVPMVSSLPAGPLEVETLLYEPFRQPTLPNGSANPAFEPTMQGWLDYVGVITHQVKAILGSEDFDVEIWNELSFGSRFLNISAYYKPNIQPWEVSWSERAILERTVAYLRNPSHGVSGIGIGNGFANQAPAWNGAESPVGLTAIDKHPYHGWDSFPGSAQVNGSRPYNGLNEPAGWKDKAEQWHESFTPTYDSFFPEYFLSGLQTETLVHDLSPYPSSEGKTLHGRYTHPEGGAPPAYWITEVNMDPATGPTPATDMTPEDIRHIETKEVLRYLTAYVNKGVTALDFYGAQAGNLSLIDPGFFKAVKNNPSTYPGDSLGGETTDAVRRLMAAMGGAEPIASPRQLSLRELTDYLCNTQFSGNGTAAYPPLYNREVFAFFPFQVSPHRFVIPVYVMTRDVAENYQPDAPESDPTRFDLPPEPYKMAIAGINGAEAQVSATDPLSGETVPVNVVSNSNEEIVVEMRATDSPRLLTIQEASGAAEPTTVEATPATTPERATRTTGRAKNRSSAGTSGLRLQLRSNKSLLRKRKLTAVANCADACDLDFSGSLRVERHDYPMRLSSQATGRNYRVTALLTVGRLAVTRARQALSKGQGVSAKVEAWTQDGSGSKPATRQTLVLRPE